MPYYVFDGANNKFEGMTKEQILAAITQAVSTHTISDVDTGFVTTLKEGNGGSALKVWVGTTAQYNALQTKENNCFYLLYDDTGAEDIENSIAEVDEKATQNAEDIDDIVDGTTPAGKATADENGVNFAQKYMRIGRRSFIGSAKTGISILGKQASAGGTCFLVNWRAWQQATQRYRYICLGVIWWSGDSVTYSAANVLQTNYLYELKITPQNTSGGCANGLAKIVMYDNTGSSSTEQDLPDGLADTELELVYITEPPVFTFTIENPYTSEQYSFSAEGGMTWQDWVASAYNTGGFFLSGVHVCDSTGQYAVSDVEKDYSILNASYSLETIPE